MKRILIILIVGISCRNQHKKNSTIINKWTHIDMSNEDTTFFFDTVTAAKKKMAVFIDSITYASGQQSGKWIHDGNNFFFSYTSSNSIIYDNKHLNVVKFQKALDTIRPDFSTYEFYIVNVGLFARFKPLTQEIEFLSKKYKNDSDDYDYEAIFNRVKGDTIFFPEPQL
jgi:hypothetical protein